MAISVKNALNLTVFKDAKILAGLNGLERNIKRVSVSECPEKIVAYSDIGDNGENIDEGDFFLTTFFTIKDDPEDMFETIKLYNENGSSGICILDEYIKEVPKKIIDYANTSGYPIIYISGLIPYADIIKEIMEAVIKNKEEDILEMKIDNILYIAKTSEDRKKILTSINNYLGKYFLTIYYKGKLKDNTFKNELRKEKGWSKIKYQDGFLFLLSFGKELKKDVSTYVNRFIKELIESSSTCYLGVSDVFSELGKINKCIKESLTAYKCTQITKEQILYYPQLGVYKLLMNIDERELEEFYQTTIVPLKEYDERSNMELLKTAIIYVDNDGDLKQTAKEMYQHQNTIRYRITKIKELLNMQDMNIKFHEQLSLAIKVYKILRLI